MTKHLLSFALIGLLLNLVGVIPAYANAQEDARAHNARKVKEEIMKLGTGEAARVELTLRDGTKLKGYIREAGEENFVVIDAKTGAATAVTYPQVKQIKGNNLSSGVKIGIKLAAVVGIALGLTVLLALVVGSGG